MKRLYGFADEDIILIVLVHHSEDVLFISCLVSIRADCV